MLATYAGISSVKEVTYERLVIKMKGSATAEDQQRLIKEFKTNMPDMYVYSISFGAEGSETLEYVDGIVTLLFDIIIIITMFLCFFSLSSSMSANLLEQAKEIGILRAIGFRKTRITMLYVYEAFILVLASSLMGILVGVGVAWSMTVQFANM